MVRKNASIVSAIAIKIPGQAPRVNPAPTNIPSTNKSMPTANTKPELLGVWPSRGPVYLANAYMNPTPKTKLVTMATKWWLATRSGTNSTAEDQAGREVLNGAPSQHVGKPVSNTSPASTDDAGIRTQTRSEVDGSMDEESVETSAWIRLTVKPPRVNAPVFPTCAETKFRNFR